MNTPMFTGLGNLEFTATGEGAVPDYRAQITFPDGIFIAIWRNGPGTAGKPGTYDVYLNSAGGVGKDYFELCPVEATCLIHHIINSYREG